MPEKRFSLVGFLLPALLMGSGCAGWRQERAPATPPPVVQAVLFTADGAGGFEATSNALRHVIAEEGLPVAVETFEWSHGYGRVFSDQIDHRHTHAAGLQLAERVEAFRSTGPPCVIYLLGHSAGAAVVLSAAAAMPPGSVDQIVLLAPSVSADRDLRPALRCARKGIDVFYSERDWWYLGLGVSLTGTADGSYRAAAGRVGFHVPALTPQDYPLYAKLRQHPWDGCVAWTGNQGGHYGGYRNEFLRYYVLPLLMTR